MLHAWFLFSFRFLDILLNWMGCVGARQVNVQTKALSHSPVPCSSARFSSLSKATGTQSISGSAPQPIHGQDVSERAGVHVAWRLSKESTHCQPNSLYFLFICYLCLLVLFPWPLVFPASVQSVPNPCMLQWSPVFSSFLSDSQCSQFVPSFFQLCDPIPVFPNLYPAPVTLCTPVSIHSSFTTMSSFDLQPVSCFSAPVFLWVPASISLSAPMHS